VPLKQRPPFVVFEAGPGRKPVGLMLKAARKRGGRQKFFIGADKRIAAGPLLRLDRALWWKFGLKKLPKNAALAVDCASRMLMGTRPGSLSVVFGSYFFNNLPQRASHCVPTHTCEEVFINSAIDALKPGGRIILVQDKFALPTYRNVAQSFGLGFYTKEIPDDTAKKSPSRAIRMRATPKKRLNVLREYQKEPGGSSDPAEVARLVREGLIASEAEFAKPVIISMKKPRKGMEERDSEAQARSELQTLLGLFSKLLGG